MKKHFFMGWTFDTLDEARDAVFSFAKDTLDYYMDECYGQVCVFGKTYRTSYALKKISEEDYRIALNNYINSLLNEIKEIESSDEVEENPTLP